MAVDCKQGLADLGRGLLCHESLYFSTILLSVVGTGLADLGRGLLLRSLRLSSLCLSPVSSQPVKGSWGSATDIDLQTKVVKPHFGVCSRQRASTVSGNEKVDTLSRSSVTETPTQSKDEEYFVRMIRKAGKDGRPSSECVSFSEQDIVDIFRSSLRGSKVPVVKVEGVDGVESTMQGEEQNGDEVDGSKESDRGESEGGKQRLRAVHSQREVQVLEGQDVNSDTVETVIIPDNISPDLVCVEMSCICILPPSLPPPSLLQYLYQSVCTIDLPGILCAKAHGGDINFINIDDEGKSPMLIAIEKVNHVYVLYMCTLLSVCQCLNLLVHVVSSIFVHTCNE